MSAVGRWISPFFLSFDAGRRHTHGLQGALVVIFLGSKVGRDDCEADHDAEMHGSCDSFYGRVSI